MQPAIRKSRELEPGMRAECRRSFSPTDLADYLQLADVGLPADQVPEPLIGGMFSYLLGTQLPGPGTNYMKQQISFRSPALAGEELLATVEVSRLRPEKQLVYLRTTCLGADGRLVAEGEALVLVKDVAADSPQGARCPAEPIEDDKEPPDERICTP